VRVRDDSAEEGCERAGGGAVRGEEGGAGGEEHAVVVGEVGVVGREGALRGDMVGMGREEGRWVD